MWSVIDGAAPVGGVLGDVRGDAQLATAGDEILGVVAFVAGDRAPPGSLRQSSQEVPARSPVPRIPWLR